MEAGGAPKSKIKEAGRTVAAQERRRKNRKAYNAARFTRRQKRKKEEEGRHLDETKSKDPHATCHPAQAFTGKNNSGSIKGDGPGCDRSSGNKTTRKRVATTCIESTAPDEIFPPQEHTGNEDFRMDETLDHEETGTQLMALTIVDETTSTADNIGTTPEIDPTSTTRQVRQSTRRRLEQVGGLTTTNDMRRTDRGMSHEHVISDITREESNEERKAMDSTDASTECGSTHDEGGASQEESLLQQETRIHNMEGTTHTRVLEAQMGGTHSQVEAPQVPIDKLRPICLLETMRKVWTAIIMSKISKTLQRHNVLQSTQAGFRPGCSTETSLLQLINIIEQAKQYHSPLYYVSYDISKAFDRPPKNILKLGWARVSVPEDIINWLVDMDVEGRAYIKSPWAQSHLDEHQKITGTKSPFFTQTTGVPQGSTEGGLSWLVIMDILLTMVKLHELSDIYIPDANDKLFRQYVSHGFC